MKNYAFARIDCAYLPGVLGDPAFVLGGQTAFPDHLLNEPFLRISYRAVSQRISSRFWTWGGFREKTWYRW